MTRIFSSDALHFERVKRWSLRGFVSQYLKQSILIVCSCLSTSVVVAAPFAYVTSLIDDTVTVIDLATESRVAVLGVGTDPWGVATSTVGPRVYVGRRGDGFISAINSVSNTVTTSSQRIGSSPEGLALSPDGKTLLVTDGGSALTSLYVVDVATLTVSKTIKVGFYPEAVAFAPDGVHAYVSNRNESTVSVVDVVAGVATATIPVGARPWGLMVSPDGLRVYVANQLGDSVSVISTATHSVTTTIATGRTPTDLVVSPSGSRVYVTNSRDNTVSVIDTATNAVVATLTGFHTPISVDIVPSGAKLVVLNQASSTASIIDTATHAVIREVPVGANAMTVGRFIVKAPQVITFVQPADMFVDADPQALKVSANSGLAVTLAVATPNVCFVIGQRVTPLATGTCTIHADQPGDFDYFAADRVTRSFQVFAPAVPEAVPALWGWPLTMLISTVGLFGARLSLRSAQAVRRENRCRDQISVHKLG